MVSKSRIVKDVQVSDSEHISVSDPEFAMRDTKICERIFIVAFQRTDMLSWYSPAPPITHRQWREGYEGVTQVLGSQLMSHGDAAPIFETHELLDDVYQDN